MKTLIALLIPVLSWTGELLAQQPEKTLSGTVKLELFNCKRDGGVTCESANTVGDKKFEVKGDSGNAEYIEFEIAPDKFASVKIGTNSGGAFFLTVGLQAYQRIERKPLFENGETIFEVDAKKSARSVQLYSPEFDLDGSLKSLKATISVE